MTLETLGALLLFVGGLMFLALAVISLVKTFRRK